jgi:RHH-type proline utilization regulon transcriptional repressor/proline dehydrogenase/delta 1-pyrroline-5-carboxylate dehydrogenase
MNQQRIEETGKSLLEYGASSFSSLNVKNWSQTLLDKMMENENFRVAALRFTDVAPTLRNDDEFMEHLGSYFGEVGNLKGFIGTNIPGSGFLGKVVAPLVRRNIKSMAHTFIAGETLEDSLHTFKKLHNNNLACAIDLLGEAVISKKEAEDFMNAYKQTIVKIAEATKTWNAPQYPEKDRIGEIARANVSIKLSALYEHVNTTAHSKSVEELCKRFRTLLDVAMENDVYVHVDTEQYQLLPITLDVFETVLMEEKYKNYPHVGIVCQAYLKDSEALLYHLIRFAEKRSTPFSIRLVKGAYWDYEQAISEQRDWPCPVFSIKEDTDANYEKLTDILIKSYPKVRPCIGSHNARSIAVAIERMRHYNLQIADVEFQMLYGMADNFRNALRSMGYRVRQYCPIGEFIPGMSYLVRRLLENTANQSFLRMHGNQEADIATLLREPQFDGARVESAEEHNAGFLNHPLKDFSIEEERTAATNALNAHKPTKPITVVPTVNGKKLSVKESIMVSCPWQKDMMIAEVKLATNKEAAQAVSCAKEAFEKWRKTSKQERAEILRKAAQIAIKRWPELFAAQVYEASKDWVHADADITEGIDFMKYYADEILSLESKFQPDSKWGEVNKTIYEPRGVMAVIAPWNFPFAISAGMTSAALVSGNTVIYKPAEQTSYTGQLLAEIYAEAGVPAGVFSFLPGKGEEVGAFLVEHKDVAGIAFTGSRSVGLKILRQSATVQAGQHHLKKCIIEMGGKNAIIVDSDADLDEAVPETVHSAFGFQGQKCSACSRVIVVGSAYEPFVARIKDMVESLKVGTPEDPSCDVNAVIDTEAYKKIEKYIEAGKSDGKLLATTDAPRGGHFIAPHVFTDLAKGSKLTTDEIFGPVLAVYKAKNVKEAVEMAMASEYKLTGGVFSRNPQTLEYVQKHFKVGNLYINRGTTGALVNRQPFGGGALSGTGTKAGGPDYLLHFVEPRVVTENSMRRGFAPKEEELG